MERLFNTHIIRESRECDPVWTLSTPDEGGLSLSEKVVVPGVWESTPALRNYRGRGIYEQKIVCGGHLRFVFGGVSFRARVFLDDRLIGEHYGAYTAFDMVARNVPDGEHMLRVEADTRFDADSALHIPNDYYCYGGISRPVTVEKLGRAYIARCRVTPRRTPDGWAADAEVTVRNLDAEPFCGKLRLGLAGAEEKMAITVAGNTSSAFTFSFFCGHPDLWSPENPALYPVSAELWTDGRAVDDLIERIGFREIRMEGRKLLLNGRSLQLKGFNRHEEYGSFGLSVPLEGMMQDIHLMKNLGANCVRTCHYPNDPRFLDLCDETGMLVWEESHARGFSEERMRHPRFMEQLRLCTEEMISQHIHHPSVFVWGSLNECADDTEYGAACYREIFSLIRRLDPSRPVTAALLERPGGKVYGDMDIVSVNLYPQWYHGTSVREALDRKIREADENGGAGKPFIVSEIGAGAIYGVHDPFGEAKWSEERQCRILEDQISAVLSHPDVTGIFLWQLADVRVDDAWAMARPRTHNNKGVVDEYRRPKLAYRTVKKCFGSVLRPEKEGP